MADGWPLALLARLFVGVLVCMWFSPRARAPSRRRVVVLPCCRVVVSSGVVASCGSGAAAVAKGDSRGPSLGRARRKRAPGAQKRAPGRRVVVSSARVVGPFLTHLLRSLSLSQDDRCCDVATRPIYYCT